MSDVEHWSPDAQAAIAAELVACTLGQRHRLELNVEFQARLARLGRQFDRWATALGEQLVPWVRPVDRGACPHRHRGRGDLGASGMNDLPARLVNVQEGDLIRIWYPDGTHRDITVGKVERDGNTYTITPEADQ